MPIEEVLKQFGLREKEIRIYFALLKLGPSSVRKISQEAGINRGTSYDVLRDLIKIGLVGYYEKKSHQYFIPEDPAKMITILEERKDKITKLKNDLKKTVDELQYEYCRIARKPFVRYFDGYAGAKEILEDVLKTVAKASNREYYVYSTESIREYIYKSFKDFSKKRVEMNIHVKVLAIGKGGELRGKDERKWINNIGESAPNYIIIYENKVAFISVNSENEPMGIIIDDKATSQMQKVIFNSIWRSIR